MLVNALGAAQFDMRIFWCVKTVSGLVMNNCLNWLQSVPTAVSECTPVTDSAVVLEDNSPAA